MPSPETVHIGIKAPARLSQAVSLAVERNGGMSVSAYVRRAIERQLIADGIDPSLPSIPAAVLAGGLLGTFMPAAADEGQAA